MMKPKLFLLIILSLAFSRCDYPLKKENNQEVDPPANTQYFDLDILSHGDTIEVFERMRINYDFNTNGLNVIEGTLQLADNIWPVFNNSGYVEIDPDHYEPDFYTLSLVLKTRSGTGSLADEMDAEGYIVEKSWPVIIENRSYPKLELYKSITDDGYLKISWDRYPYLNFTLYALKISINDRDFEFTVHNIDSTYFVDSIYVGGTITARITTIEPIQGIYNNSINFTEYGASPSISELGLDSLRISWPESEYHAKYRVVRTSGQPDEILVNNTIDTSITTYNPGFGVRRQYFLYTIPINCDNLSSNDIIGGSVYYVFGDYLVSYHNRYAYNAQENIVYTNKNDSMFSYDASSLERLSAYYIDDLQYGDLFACPSNSSKVITFAPGNVYVFENSNLQNPLTIGYSSSIAGIDFLYCTDNGYVAIAKNSKLDLISLSNQQLVNSIPISDYPLYAMWTGFSVSKDGKYACVNSENEFSIYYIENGNDSLLYFDQISYRSVYFNINNPSQLFLTLKNSNDFEIRDPANFSLINTIALPTNSQILLNIDPVSGYLLLTDLEYLYVLDLSTHQVILKVQSSDNYPQMYNKRLFSYSGYTLDISQYLPL